VLPAAAADAPVGYSLSDQLLLPLLLLPLLPQ
jgi:hypothetical protein